MEPGKMSEAITEGSRAITKFGEIVDKMFTPRWTRKKADADAYADERRLKVIRDNPDMEIVYTNGSMNARARNPEALIYRAEQRQLAETIRQEDNLENILAVAEQEVFNESTGTNQNVEDDWIIRFFEIAKNISSEELQKMWGKILAGEIINPGSFSLRTLETLRNLSTSEASIFQKVLPLILNVSGEKILPYDEKLLDRYGVTYGDILRLDDCGLINSSRASMSFGVSNKTILTHYVSNRTLAMTGNIPEVKVELGIYRFTKTASELASILCYTPNDLYFEDYARMLYEANKSKGIVMAVHQVNFIQGMSVNYQDEPILVLKD